VVVGAVMVVVVVGGSGCDGGGGSGIVHSKINTALCAKLIMTFAVVSDKLLFI
jgi:hypothetical protein